MKKVFERGAILVETAVTVSLLLTLVIFSIDVGVLGFLQETTDAASFVYARGSSIGVNNAGGVSVAVHQMFPQIPTTSVSAVPLPAATLNVGINYNFNGTPAQQASAQTNRHGGYSALQPLGIAGNVNLPRQETLQGYNINVEAQEREAYLRECGAHFNVAGSTAQCGGGSEPSNYDVNSILNGENVAPYFVGFNYVNYCSTSFPWGSTTCPSTPTEYSALSLAEVLYDHNPVPPNGSYGGGDQHQFDGQEESDNATEYQYSSNFQPDDEIATFTTISCLNRQYAWLSEWLTQYPTLTSFYQQWYAPGPVPSTGIYADEYTACGSNGSNSGNCTQTANGVHYQWSTGGDVPQFYNSGNPNTQQPYDYNTNLAFSILYRRDQIGLLSGYASNAGAYPGNYFFGTNDTCGNQAIN